MIQDVLTNFEKISYDNLKNIGENENFEILVVVILCLINFFINYK